MNIGIAKLINFENLVACKELNALTGDITYGGILPVENKLKPRRLNITSSEIEISTGIAVFNGGTKLVVSSPITFTVLSDVVIYAIYSNVLRTGGIYASETYPEGEYIPIAEKIGYELFDMRKTAVSTTTRENGNVIETGEFNELISAHIGGVWENNDEWVEVCNVEMTEDFSEMIIHTLYNRDELIRAKLKLKDGYETEAILFDDDDGDKMRVKISRHGRTLSFWGAGYGDNYVGRVKFNYLLM